MFRKNDPALNYIVIGGMRSPGRARVSGADTVHEWDTKSAYGMSGAKSVYKGRNAIEFSVAIDMWKDEHFLAWDVFKKFLEPPTLTNPTVVEIQHPILSASGITAAGVKKVGQISKGDNGLWTVDLDFIEIRPLKPSLQEWTRKWPSTNATPPVTAKTGIDLELEQQSELLKAARVRASGVTSS